MSGGLREAVEALYEAVQREGRGGTWVHEAWFVALLVAPEPASIKVMDCNAADLHSAPHVWDFGSGEHFACFGNASLLAEHPATGDEEPAQNDHWTCGGCGYEGNGPDNLEWYEHTKVCPDLHPAEPDAGEVGGLADVLYRARQSRTIPDTVPEILDARAVLASDWLAAHDAKVKAEAWDKGWGAGVSGRYGRAENPYRADRIEQQQ